VEAVETKETPLQKAGEEQKPETTTTTRDVATAAPKPQASTAGYLSQFLATCQYTTIINH